MTTRQDLRNRRPTFTCAAAPLPRPRVNAWPAIIRAMLAISAGVALAIAAIKYFGA